MCCATNRKWSNDYESFWTSSRKRLNIDYWIGSQWQLHMALWHVNDFTHTHIWGCTGMGTFSGPEKFTVFLNVVDIYFLCLLIGICRCTLKLCLPTTLSSTCSIVLHSKVKLYLYIKQGWLVRKWFNHTHWGWAWRWWCSVSHQWWFGASLLVRAMWP